MKTDDTLADLAKVKRQAAAEYAEELKQFKGRNEHAYATLDALRDAAQEAKLLFDALYVTCVIERVQLDLFRDQGIEVDLVTKVTLPKRAKATADQGA